MTETVNYKIGGIMKYEIHLTVVQLLTQFAQSDAERCLDKVNRAVTVAAKLKDGDRSDSQEIINKLVKVSEALANVVATIIDVNTLVTLSPNKD